MQFQGAVQPLFQGLDTSNQGKLWREDFDYLWLLTLEKLQKRRDEAHQLESNVVKVGGTDKPLDDWEPSEHEATARDFAQWACTHWDTILHKFAHEASRTGQGVPILELERWLNMLKYTGDILAVFTEINRERPASGSYDDTVITTAQLASFRTRRNTIA